MRERGQPLSTMCRSSRKIHSCARCWPRRVLSRSSKAALGFAVRLFAHHAFAFLDRNDFFSAYTGKAFDFPIGPVHGDIGGGRLADAEVKAEIALGQIGTTAPDFIHLL